MWKGNWEQTQQRFVKWWNREGLLIGMWGAPETGACIHETVSAPGKARHARRTLLQRRLSRGGKSLPARPLDFPAGRAAERDHGPRPRFARAFPRVANPVLPRTRSGFIRALSRNPSRKNSRRCASIPNHRWWHTTEDILRRCVGTGARQIYRRLPGPDREHGRALVVARRADVVHGHGGAAGMGRTKDSGNQRRLVRRLPAHLRPDQAGGRQFGVRRVLHLGSGQGREDAMRLPRRCFRRKCIGASSYPR